MGSGLGLIIKNFIAQFMGTGLAIGFTIIGARMLSVAEYGELRYVMTLLPLFMAFSMPGYDSIILRNTNLRTHVPLGSMFKVRLIMGVIGSVAILCGMVIMRASLNPTLTFFLLTTALFLPLFETASGYKNYLIGRGLRHQSLNLVFQTRLLCFAIFLFCFGVFYLANISMIYIYPAYLMAMIAPTLLAFSRVVLRWQGRALKHRHKKGPTSIMPAAAATLAGVIYTLAFSLDKLMVRHELGPEQLALYGLLIMAPQELAKIMDSTIPLFYRNLFFSEEPLDLRKMRLLFILLPLLVLSFIISFYELSAFIFGAAYTYSLLSVALAGLLIFGLAMEYLYNHKIFAAYGSNSMFTYSLTNLATSAIAIPLGLYMGGINGLMLALLAKQLIVPPSFFALRQRYKSEVTA